MYILDENVRTQVKYTDFEFHEGYIITIVKRKKGVLLYNGVELLEPLYKRVAHFHEDIFMGVQLGGKKTLNSPHWTEKSCEADEFFPPVHGGIRAKNGEYFAMIDAQTGKNITDFVYHELTNFNKYGYAYVLVEVGAEVKKINREGIEMPTQTRMIY